MCKCPDKTGIERLYEGFYLEVSLIVLQVFETKDVALRSVFDQSYVWSNTPLKYQPEHGLSMPLSSDSVSSKTKYLS